MKRTFLQQSQSAAAPQWGGGGAGAPVARAGLRWRKGRRVSAVRGGLSPDRYPRSRQGMVKVPVLDDATSFTGPVFRGCQSCRRQRGGPRLDVRKFKSLAVLRPRSSPSAEEASLQIAPLLWLAFW